MAGKIGKYQCYFRALLPSGWNADTTLTLRSPDSRANIRITDELVEPTMTTHEYAKIIGDAIRLQNPDYKQLSEYDFTTPQGRSCVRREFEYPRQETFIRQAQVYFVDVGGHAILVTFTSTAADYPKFEPTFSDIFDYLLVDHGFSIAG